MQSIYCKYCLINNFENRLPLLYSISIRTLFGVKKFVKKPEPEPLPNPIEEEKIFDHGLTEEEIMKIRDKSGLSEKDKNWIKRENLPKFYKLRQFKKTFVRYMYAQYGRASGIKPGINWPTREELQFMKEYEEKFHPPLQVLVDKVNAKKQAEIDYRVNREKEILANLKKLPKWKKEFFEKYHQMHKEAENERLKKEKLIQDVREFLGYDLDPSDPRFQEALIKKEEEEKKAAKLAQKGQKQSYTMTKLAALVEEAKIREQQELEQEAKKKEARAKAQAQAKAQSKAKAPSQDQTQIETQSESKENNKD